jgi:hypothetical protein
VQVVLQCNAYLMFYCKRGLAYKPSDLFADN